MIAKRTLGAWAGITAATLAVVVGVNAQTSTATATAPKAPKALPACQHEDGSTQRACYWDAQRQGNGKGWSMIHMNYGRQTIMVSWLPASCKALSQLPAYRVMGEDGMMTIPAGTELINQMIEMRASNARMSRECNGWLAEYGQDHLK